MLWRGKDDFMSTSSKQKRESDREDQRARRVSKKDQIISLYTSGIGEVEDLAMITGSRPSYVASVLQDSGLMTGYFDLYTTSSHPMNVYSKFFARKLGFKDEEAAQASIELIDRLYNQFGIARDRAGQHHALMMALTMFDRARWTGKASEADIFRQWLLARLNDTEAGEESEGAPEQQA
jgi:hypothetical protein